MVLSAAFSLHWGSSNVSLVGNRGLLDCRTQCYRMNLHPPNSHGESHPWPQCGGIRRWFGVRWGDEGGTLVNGVSALVRVRRALASPVCSLPCVDAQGRLPPVTWRGLSPDPSCAATLISHFQPPEQWEISSCCLQATQYVVFLVQQPEEMKPLKEQKEEISQVGWG